jgi:hypothetical protein
MFLAAGPAAGSSRSVGVFGKGAEAGDPVEEPGRLGGGFHFVVMAFRAGRTAGNIAFQDRPLEGVFATRAFVFDSRHDPILPPRSRLRNKKPWGPAILSENNLSCNVSFCRHHPGPAAGLHFP